MLSAIVRFCVKEPWLVILLVLLTSITGWISYRNIPIDAIPNIGENQVIVLTAWPGRSPKDIEDQVTYPLSVSLLAVPGAESVRGKSMFGYSFVQVTFADNVDFYWARSRVNEQLSTAVSKLPPGVAPELGPDATGLGQIFYYVLKPPQPDAANGLDSPSLADLRSLQDFVIKFELQAVEGVSEVASIGGYVRQYQIEVDPDMLRFHGVTLDTLAKSIKSSNLDVGAKTIESTGMEYIVRGKGFLGTDGDQQQAIRDIESTVVVQRNGVPVKVKDVASVQIGPEFRRGALDHNGAEAVGGVVVMRYGENPREVIKRINKKIAAITPSLGGVTIHGVYDRSGLIDETVATLTDALRDEILITAVIILLFLLHIRSSIIVALCLPVAVLLSFIAMQVTGVGANIMSLAGIAIAIGTMVDMGIIVSENIYQRVEAWERENNHATPAELARQSKQKRIAVISAAALEVVPAVVTAVLTTIVSFLPVFFLTGRDHRLFAPLAYTKTFAIAAAMLAAVTLVPALSRLFLRSVRYRAWQAALAACGLSGLLMCTSYFLWSNELATILNLPEWVPTVAVGLVGFAIGWQILRERLKPIEQSPSSRIVNWIYAARLRFALNNKFIALIFPLILLAVGVGAYTGFPSLLSPVNRFARFLGADLNQFPGYVEATHLHTGLESDDWIALDEGSWFYMPTLYPAASFSQAMQVLQTQDVLIKQIPEVAEVLGKIGRVDSALDPAPAAMIETYVMLRPKSQWRPGLSSRDIWDAINDAARLPGVTPASALQPIEGRVVMLQSGIKAAMAIRIYGDNLEQLARSAFDVAELLKGSPYVNANTVSPDVVLGKPYIEFTVDRDAAARYGMTTQMVNQVIETALGGVGLTQTVEGRERYPVRLRYNRNLREQVDQLARLPVVTESGAVVPLEELATLTTSWGPSAINSENGRLVAHVSFMKSDLAGSLESIAAIENELAEAQKTRGDNNDESENANRLALPAGYSLEAVGSFRSQLEANQRLLWIIPLVMLINLMLIYFQFRSWVISLIVFTGIPVAFAGGMILIAAMDVQLNTAVWIGFIALFGLAVDDGVVMATYIRQLLSDRKISNPNDIREAVYQAGLKRIRPCTMTTITTICALIPVLLADGRGADVARAMAIPVFGGMLVEPFTSFIVPTLYCAFLELKMTLALPDELWSSGSKLTQQEREVSQLKS